MDTNRDVIVTLPEQRRGRRMTHDEADALLTRQGFVHKVHERVVTHRSGRQETVIRIWENASYERAVTKARYYL
ncbi:hypothetical protein [Nocardia sp. CC227C]|uniref:hypothetical protein n=1 Tax=Nocardia sp. CC227C TaxID=3044562 RepID=UPI00278C537B|nr:hypothetical protein [Nocardia sp. CC227C]